MPLSRFQLRNEYGLGVRELYGEASKREDPKAVLDGVAVAGLVGLLRQLGDLAEFAAEAFHGLQEEITSTSSRSRKLMTRVKHIEAVLPPLEKAMLSQTSHIHFAYTPGTEWHPRIRNEQNHFICTDMPRCIVDSYEECREPPCLQSLDKFDTGGPGSCLKRYSDPAFFRKASGNSTILKDEKSNKERKARKAKKKRSWKRSSQLSFDASNFSYSGRVQFPSPPQQRQPSPTQTASTFDMTFKSDLVDRSDSPGSGDGMGFIECVFHPSASAQTDETRTKHSVSEPGDRLMSNLGSKYPGKQTLVTTKDTPRRSVVEMNGHTSSTDTWDEKAEILEPMVQHTGKQEVPSLRGIRAEFGSREIEPTVWKSGSDKVRELHEVTFQFDEPDIEPIRWSLRSYGVPELMETKFEADDPETKPAGQISSEINEMPEGHEKNFQINDLEMVHLSENCGGNEKLEVQETNLQHEEQELEQEIEESLNAARTSFEVAESPKLILDKNQLDEMDSETENFVDALNAMESESENDLDFQTNGELRLCSHPTNDFQGDVGVDDERIADDIDDHLLEYEPPSVSYNDLDLYDSNSSPLPACSMQHTCAPHDISGRELCEDPKSLVSSGHSDMDATSQSMQSSPVHDVCSGISFTKDDGNVDVPRQESATASGEYPSVEFEATRMLAGTSEFEPTSMMAGRDEGTINSPYVSEQPSVKSSNVDMVAFWTNGGLLGLQPSKPPDFSTSGNSVSVGHLNQNLRPKADNLQEKLNSSATNSRCGYGNADFEQPALVSDSHEIDSSKKLPLQFSNSGMDKELNKSVGFDLSKISAHSQSQLLPSVMHPEANAHDSADAGATSNETIHTNEGRTSFLSGLGQGLLVNGFRRTRSLEYNELPNAVRCEKAHDLERNPNVTLHRTSSGTKLREELPSPSISAPPSPPLQHMKISFQPFSSLGGASKLKLKYPEGINQHDEDLDEFPSFQLVPEPILQHDIDSDSDDDTFCRSNPCMSDDGLSHLSDSNSELWESEDSSESRDHSNKLCRISSGESLSSFTEHEETTKRSIPVGFISSHVHDKVGVAHTSSSPVPDIPLFQPMNPFGFQETQISHNPKAPPEPFDLRELTPELPPLPPLQWRVSKPQPDALEGNDRIPGFSSLFSDSVDLGSSFPHPAKPASDDLLSTGNELVNVTTRNTHSDEQMFKVNAQEETNQAGNVRRVDEQDDFLHQIKKRSSNLRKTGLLRPAPTLVAPAPLSGKFTAILEKANAIRQAVASDDGEEDDPWSDT